MSNRRNRIAENIIRIAAGMTWFQTLHAPPPDFERPKPIKKKPLPKRLKKHHAPQLAEGTIHDDLPGTNAPPPKHPIRKHYGVQPGEVVVIDPDNKKSAED